MNSLVIGCHTEVDRETGKVLRQDGFLSALVAGLMLLALTTCLTLTHWTTIEIQTVYVTQAASGGTAIVVLALATVVMSVLRFSPRESVMRCYQELPEHPADGNDLDPHPDDPHDVGTVLSSWLRRTLQRKLPIIGIVLFFVLGSFFDILKVIAHLYCIQTFAACGSQTLRRYVVDLVFYPVRLLFMGVAMLFCMFFHGKVFIKRPATRYALIFVQVAVLTVWFDTVLYDSKEIFLKKPIVQMENCSHLYNDATHFLCLFENNSLYTSIEKYTAFFFPLNVQFLLLVSQIVLELFFGMKSTEALSKLLRQRHRRGQWVVVPREHVVSPLQTESTTRSSRYDSTESYARRTPSRTSTGNGVSVERTPSMANSRSGRGGGGGRGGASRLEADGISDDSDVQSLDSNVTTASSGVIRQKPRDAGKSSAGDRRASKAPEHTWNWRDDDPVAHQSSIAFPERDEESSNEVDLQDFAGGGRDPNEYDREPGVPCQVRSLSGENIQDHVDALCGHLQRPGPAGAAGDSVSAVRNRIRGIQRQLDAIEGMLEGSGSARDSSERHPDASLQQGTLMGEDGKVYPDASCSSEGESYHDGQEDCPLLDPAVPRPTTPATTPWLFVTLVANVFFVTLAMLTYINNGEELWVSLYLAFKIVYRTPMTLICVAGLYLSRGLRSTNKGFSGMDVMIIFTTVGNCLYFSFTLIAVITCFMDTTAIHEYSPDVRFPVAYLFFPIKPYVLWLLLSNILVNFVQTFLQTGFMFHASRVTWPRNENGAHPHVRSWYRLAILYLTICNLATWLNDAVVEFQNLDRMGSVQEYYYDTEVWNVIYHVTNPLTIFYRFACFNIFLKIYLDT